MDVLPFPTIFEERRLGNSPPFCLPPKAPWPHPFLRCFVTCRLHVSFFASRVFIIIFYCNSGPATWDSSVFFILLNIWFFSNSQRDWRLRLEINRCERLPFQVSLLKARRDRNKGQILFQQAGCCCHTLMNWNQPCHLWKQDLGSLMVYTIYFSHDTSLVSSLSLFRVETSARARSHRFYS